MNIGDTVTVRALNPLWARREAYAYPIAQYQSYTGPVLPNPSWVSAEQICIGTGNVAYPFRVIEKARIQGYSQVSAASEAQKRTWAVPGSKPGLTYLVTREGTQWGCNCVGFGVVDSGCACAIRACCYRGAIWDELWSYSLCCVGQRSLVPGYLPCSATAAIRTS